MKQITFGEYKNVIGKVLARIRTERGLSQGELAAKMQVLGVNIDQQMISKIERNQRQVTDYEFACFSLCLKVDTSEFLQDFYTSLKGNGSR